jgi:predicted permease
LFTTFVVATLMLGIGANAAMFGIVDRMLFRPAPYLIEPATAHRVYPAVMVRGKERISGGTEYATFADIRDGTTSFSVGGISNLRLAVGVGDDAKEMRVAAVNAAFFKFFDAPALVGRYFTSAEDSIPVGAPVAVLNYATWEMKYGKRPDVIGERVQIGPVIYTIIGVAPRGFVGVWSDVPPAYFIPITSYAAAQSANASWLRGKQWWTTYSWGWMQMMVRRKPGVSVEAANADLLNAARRSYQRQLVEEPKGTPMALAKPRAFLAPILTEAGPNGTSVGKVAAWSAGVAVVVLLIACANVANLLLARALRRRREIAVRLALGVSRGRLLRQLVTESVVLAALGGAAGLLVAQWGGAVLRARLFPRTAGVSTVTDARTIAFAATAALLVALLVSLAPALQARRADLTSDLKSGNREGTHTRSRTRLVLLVLQAALSVVLLVGAGLLVRSLRNAESVPLGFDVDPLVSVDLNMRGVTLDSVHAIALRTELLEAARGLPGVSKATFTRAMPFWNHSSTSLFVDGIDTVARLGRFEYNPVSPDYFAAMGTRVIRGRAFTSGDIERSQRVMVVSEAMGKRLWPGQDPIGKCVRLRADTMPCTYVVGVAENIKNQSLSDDPGLYYYMPATQWLPQSGGLFVRTAGPAAPRIEAIRQALQKHMPGASYITATPFTDVIGSQIQSWTLGATIFTAFGGLALVLAAIGLYSVLAYSVTQRTHEMGVRVALGAQSADVVRLVVREGLVLVASGIVIGAMAALAAGKWVRPLLFEVSPSDPLFAVVVGLLLLVAILASWIPARRASRIDPQLALRTE